MSDAPRGAVQPPEGTRRVGLFGGSFDPVHNAHLHVARCAEAAFALEWVVFMPAARPPHKPGQRLADEAHRCAMLQLALADRPNWVVSTLELGRSGPSFTIDTVRALPASLGLDTEAELFLLIGGDNLPSLPAWREGTALLRETQPVVVQRDASVEAALATLRETLEPELHARLARGLLPVEPMPISSSQVRAALARGEDVGELVPRTVAEYIRAHGLYAALDPDHAAPDPDHAAPDPDHAARDPRERGGAAKPAED